MGGARAVEADAGKVRRVGWQNEIAIGCAVETNDNGGIDAELQANRSDGNQGGGLGVDQLGHDDQYHRVGPRGGLHYGPEIGF